MADSQQAWNPVEAFKQKYPKAGYSDQEIYRNLSNPSMFKSAFPDYAHLGDDEIKNGVGQFASKYAPADLSSNAPAMPRPPMPAGLEGPSPASSLPLQAPAPPSVYDSKLTPPEQIQRAASHDYGQTSMGPSTKTLKAPSDAYAVKPNTVKSFIQNAGLPTSQPEATEMVRGMLTPQADPNEQDKTLKFGEQIPIFGGDIKARAALYRKGDTVGSMLPFYGPARAAAADKFNEGDYAGAAGAGLNAILSLAGLRHLGEPARAGLDSAAGKPPSGPGQLRPAGELNAPPQPPKGAGTFTNENGVQTTSTLPSAKQTSPAQERAFNAINPDNAEIGTTSITPEYRNAAAKDAQANPANPKTSVLTGNRKLSLPRGKAGVEKSIQLAQDAIDAHNDVVSSVKAAYKDQPLDLTPAANAALSKITPEMEIAARTDPSVAAVVNGIRDVATRVKNANTIDLADQLRHTYNDELDAQYNKPEQKQDVAPAITQAKQDAVNTLRTNFYDRLADLSGRDDVRGLAQKEADLIRAKAAMTKTGNAALRSPANSKNFLGRALSGAARSEGGVSSVVPNHANIYMVPWNIGHALINPDFGTPTGDFLSNVKTATSNLGVPEDIQPFVDARPKTLAGKQTSMLPTPGPLFDVSQTPDTTHPSAPAIPFGASDLLKPGEGSARGTHSPYKVGQPIAAAVEAGPRAAMENAEYGGFRVGSDETPAYGQTRRPLVTEEYSQIDASPRSKPMGKLPSVSGGSPSATPEAPVNKLNPLWDNPSNHMDGPTPETPARLKNDAHGTHKATYKEPTALELEAQKRSGYPADLWARLTDEAKAPFIKQAQNNPKSVSRGEWLGSDAPLHLPEDSGPKDVGTDIPFPTSYSHAPLGHISFGNEIPIAKAAAQIEKLHAEGGGSTFNLHTGNLAGKDAYAVSTNPERTLSLNHPPTAADMRDFIERNHDLLSQKNKSVGTWDDGKGNHVLDVVSTVGDEGQARSLGQQHSQDAIYHLGGKDQIDLPKARGAAAASAPVDKSDIPGPVRDALGLTRDRAENAVRADQGSSRLPGVQETMNKTNTTYSKVESYVRTQPTIGLSALKERFGFSTPEAISMLDQLESKGVVKPASGSGPRSVTQKTKGASQ